MKELVSVLVMVAIGAASAGASDHAQVMFYKAPPMQGPAVVHAAHHRAAAIRPAPERPLFEQFLEWLKVHPAVGP